MGNAKFLHKRNKPLKKFRHSSTLSCSIHMKNVQSSHRLNSTINLRKHIFPNMLPTIIVQMTVTIPALIIGEAVLSFLGLGAQSPQTSWGVMLSDAKDYYETAPQLILYPGLAIFFCSLSFNLLGDGLRDVLDPRTTR